MEKLLKICGIVLLVFLLAASCEKEEVATEVDDDDLMISEEVPEVYQKIYGASDIYVEGDFIVIKVDGLPDHKSPYYVDTQWEATRYETYNGDNAQFHLNPNRISAYDFTYKIPKNPKQATNHAPTALGSIGVALNGVSIFNQYAGPNNQPLTNEINSFDQYNGHPQQQGVYHYHVEPTYLTGAKGKDALLGFLLDGFPVYGPFENGSLITNADLDEFHGHEHATSDYPEGIYHYHITDADPYINGSGYYGTVGTVTR